MQAVIRTGSRPGCYTLLLVSLLVLMIASAFLVDRAGGRMVGNVLLGVTLVLSIYPVRRQRFFVLFGGSIAAVTFVALWIAQLANSQPANLVALTAGCVFFLHAALVILVAILRKARINVDELAGAVSAYLLAGISFAFLFALMDAIYPGSIVTTSAAVAALSHGPESRPFGVYMYFSFTCMTTLGFGDLVPATPLARVIAYLSAVLGQVYLTVLVARLVGLHITQSHHHHEP